MGFMGHSDNTAWELRGMQRRGRNFKLNWRRPRVRAARQQAKIALASGREPEPRTRNERHGALWDCF
jgi:hypothetical protein